MSYEIIGRRDAAAAGLTRYYTGKPCLHGHDAERFVSSGRCLTCSYPFAKPKGNAYTQALRKFQASPFWVLKVLSPAELDEMNVYLQHCVNAFTDHKAATDYHLAQEWQNAKPFAVPGNK